MKEGSGNSCLSRRQARTSWSLAVIAVTLGFSVPAGSEVVQAPARRAEVVFTVPPDKPHPVTFNLQGWVCIEGDLGQAIARLKAKLEKTPYSLRPALLGLDLRDALQKTGGIRIIANPAITVPAPGRKTVQPCHDTESWAAIRSHIEKVISSTPYTAVQKVDEGAIKTGQTGRKLLIPKNPNKRPESVARLPEGSTVTGGTPIGKAPGLSVDAAQEKPNPLGKPVLGKAGRLVGHVQTDPTGAAWFTPETSAGAMPAEPQRVEILPGGHIVWGTIGIGKIASEEPATPHPAKPAIEDPAGKPVYGNDGQIIGHLMTGPDGRSYLAPQAPPGAMPAEPQLVERFPDGTIMWAGRRIGSLKRPAAHETTTPVVEADNAPARPRETTRTPATTRPLDAEQAALDHIKALEKARSIARFRIRDLQRQKNRIHAQIIRLLKSRDFSKEKEINQQVRKLEERWEKLRKQQTRHFDRLDRLRAALAEARKGLPKARALAREQRRRLKLAAFVKELYRDRPQPPIPPIAELIVFFERAVGSDTVDRIIADFNQQHGSKSPVGFLGFLRDWIRNNISSSSSLNKGIEQDYLRIITAILRDPDRARLWGMKPADMAPLRESALKALDKQISNIRARLKTGRKLRSAYDLTELQLLKASLINGKSRLDQENRIAQTVAELEKLTSQKAPKDIKAANAFWDQHAEKLRQLIMLAGRAESPFARRVSGLIAHALAKGLVAQADLANAPDDKVSALRLAAARAFLLAGDRASALAQASLAEQDGDATIRQGARALQLLVLNDLKTRQGLLTPAERRIIVLHGQGKTVSERIRNGIDATLIRIIDDPETQGGDKLKAALTLWQQGAPDSRKKASEILDRMLAEVRENDENIPPLLAAWEALGKWPTGKIAPRKRADVLERIIGGSPETLVALDQLIFSADLRPDARKNLVLAADSLFWRILRREKDETARNRLIRAAIAHYRRYIGHYFLNDPDTLLADVSSISNSEIDRVVSNLRYWIDRLPEKERARYAGVISFARSAMQILVSRAKARARLEYGDLSRTYDIDKLIKVSFEQFRKGNIANAAKAFERVLTILEREGSDERSRALIAAMLRLVNRQIQSDLPIFLGDVILERPISKEKLAALALISPEERKNLHKINKTERKALAKFRARLKKKYARALDKLISAERETIVNKTGNAIIALPETSSGETAKKLARLRNEQLAALQRLRRLERRKLELGRTDRDGLERRRGKLNARIWQAERELDALKGKSGDPTEAASYLRQRVMLKLVELNILRAERDAVVDLLLKLHPRFNGIRTPREQLARKIFDEINGRPDRPNERLRKNGILQQLFTDDDDSGLTAIILKDRLRYLRARRRAVILENPNRDPSENVAAYLRELNREKSYWKGEGKRLSYGPFDLGRDQRAYAEKLERDLRYGETPTLIDRLITESQRANPQKFFALLAGLQDIELDKGLASYNKYLETPWYRLGASQAYYLASGYLGLGSEWGYDKVLDRFTRQINETGSFNAALKAASRLTAKELKQRNRRAYDLLKRQGFIKEGKTRTKYVIPRGFVFHAGTDLDKASKRTALDNLVNAKSAAETLLTVIIPGRLSFAATEYVASRWIAMNALGRLGVEAAFFTGYSRAGALMLDPSLALEKDYWNLKTWLKDYAHNVVVMGGLQLSGLGATRLGETVRDGAPLRYGAEDIMNMPLSQLREVTPREWSWFLLGGAGKVGVEAATLQAIDRVFNGTPVNGEGLLRNLVFLAELKAVGLPFNKALDVLKGGATPRENARDRERRQAERESALQVLMKDYNGDWHQLVDAFKAGKVPKDTMRELTQIRKEIVDALANEVVLNIYGIDRMAREKLWDAVGSVNLTSDYDLSFKGEKAELAVLLFNDRFRSRWGKAFAIGGVESAGRLDTNVYTYPRYREYVGNDKDVVSQETAAQLGVRRYATDAEWQAHRNRVLDALEGAKKAQMRDILDRVEQGYAEAQRELEKLSAGGDENARIYAANTLYGRSLKRIIELRENFAKAKTDAERSRIAQQIRDTQAKALYFASEAYLTEAAINHIVFNTQMVGRKITSNSLLSGKTEKLEVPMTKNEARQSLFEQLGYLLHQYSHYQGYEKNPAKAVKLAGKLSKYFLRMLDAAHLAGVDLHRIEDLVKLTVKVEKNRGNTEKLAEMLPGQKAAEFARDVRKAMEWLTGEVYQQAPLSIVQPRKQPPPKPKAKEISTEPTGGRRTTGETHGPRAAGPGPAGGQKDDKRDHEQANARGERHEVVDGDGNQNGWVYRDPNGQAWFQPLGMPGSPPPPPQKVQLLKGGGIVTPYRKIGRAVPASARPSGAVPKATPPANSAGRSAGRTARRQTRHQGMTGRAARSGATGPANKPVAPNSASRKAPPSPPRAEKEKTDAAMPDRGTDGGERPVLDAEGNVLGWIETDPNGQKWFRPDVPEGVMVTPPQKVEIAADGSVVLGDHKIGKLGPKAKPSAGGKRHDSADAAEGGAVRDAKGHIIGHLRKDPTGKIWFSPEVPPDILVTPPQAVEVLGNGQVILGGRIIGYAQPQKGGRQVGQAPLPKGEQIELVVRVVHDARPKTAIAAPPAPAVRIPAPAMPQLVIPGTPPAPAAPKGETPRETRGAGFEGLWLGWRGAVIRHVREGNVIKGVIVKATPEDLKFGWKVGDVFYEGVVKDGKLTGTAFIPFTTSPDCGPKRAKARFEAWLVDGGEAINSRAEILGLEKGCKIVHTGKWGPLIKAKRIHDEGAASRGDIGLPPDANRTQSNDAARSGQPPQGRVSPKTPVPFTPRPVPDFNPVLPGNGPQPALPAVPGVQIPTAPTPPAPRTFDLPPLPPGTPPRDVELFNAARRLISTAPNTLACTIYTSGLYSNLVVFTYYLKDRQYFEQANTPSQPGRQIRANLKRDMELVKSCGGG